MRGRAPGGAKPDAREPGAAMPGAREPGAVRGAEEHVYSLPVEPRR